MVARVELLEPLADPYVVGAQVREQCSNCGMLMSALERFGEALGTIDVKELQNATSTLESSRAPRFNDTSLRERRLKPRNSSFNPPANFI